jgi:hypothetical protein
MAALDFLRMALVWSRASMEPAPLFYEVVGAGELPVAIELETSRVSTPRYHQIVTMRDNEFVYPSAGIAGS